MAKYIVNHGGEVHSVNEADFALALANGSRKPSPEDPIGKAAREATAEEIAAWWAKQGFVYDAASDTAKPVSSANDAEGKKAAK